MSKELLKTLTSTDPLATDSFVTVTGTAVGTKRALDVNVLSAPLSSQASSTAVLTQIASSITAVTVLNANANRKFFIFVNDEVSNCYIAFGATATTSAYTILLLANSGTYTSDVIWTGTVSAIWVSAGSKGLKVTEFTL